MFSNQRDTKHDSRNMPAPRGGTVDRKVRTYRRRPGDVSDPHHEEVSVMRKFIARVSVIAISTMLAFASAAQAQTKTITLCWAAWDPANALVEL